MERSVRRKKIKFGCEVFCKTSLDDMPLVQLAPLQSEVVASYSGPDSGLAFLHNANSSEHNGNVTPVAGCGHWNRKEQQAYGICISLYEQHPVNGKMSGDPIADAFAVCARKNNGILLIADGVNWGEKSRLAARCALYGSMSYINRKMFDEKRAPSSTQAALSLLRESFNEAHKVILKKEGGLTTLCACLVCPVSNSDQFAVCCVNVGDSYAFVYSQNHGIREVTIGSHDVSLERDIRDAGGALGPVDGNKPELHNLTYSLTFCNPGDIVFLTTDGISDNFDPVVTKIAIARKERADNLNDVSPESQEVHSPSKPDMMPQERHMYSLKEMERVVHEYELVTEENCSAQEFCSAMVQHVLTLTDSKRKILENPALYVRKRLTAEEREQRDSQIMAKMGKAPGKLDHASIVALEVGAFMDPEPEELDEEEKYKTALDRPPSSSAQSIPPPMHSLPINCPNTRDLAMSPTSPTPKKSGAKKFLSKLRNFPSPTLPSPSSQPSSAPSLRSPPSLPASPRRSQNKRTRGRIESEPCTPSSPTSPDPPFDSTRVVRSPPRGMGKDVRYNR